MPSPITTNVLVGDANMFYAPFGMATPGQGEPLPNDALPLGSAWGGNWTYAGGSLEGWTYSVDATTTDITIEEQSNPVLTPIDTSDFMLSGTLMEDVLASMQLAYGRGTINSVAAGTARVDASCTTTSASATVTDAAILATDRGRPVTGVGIPAGSAVGTVTAGVSFTLVNAATGAAALATASGSTVSLTFAAAPAVNSYVFSDQLIQYSFGLEGVNANGLARRIYVPLATAAAKVDTAYRRAKAARQYPVTLRGLCAPSLVQIRELGPALTA